MIKNITSLALVLILMLVSLSYLWEKQDTKLLSEGRSITRFPELPSTLSKHKLHAFFQNIDTFLADNMPLREHLLNITKDIQGMANSDLNPKKCYRGLENWLFLGNDYANCVDKLEGIQPLPEKKLQDAINKYSRIAQQSTNAGSRFAILIGSNKSSIYPEFLPPIVIPAKNRYITPLVDALLEKGITVYDPTKDLIEAKKEGILYGLTDTHWNVKGSYVAFEGLRKLFDLPKLGVTHVDAPPQALGLVRIGGYKTDTFPLLEKDNFYVVLDHQPELTREGRNLAWLNTPNGQRDQGLIQNHAATTKQSIWIFTDSFSAALVPYIVASFKEATFFYHKQFEKIMATQSPKPDIILWVHVERHFL